ncbi:hypothetical protein N1851_022126 [Merluccius polli]|uniref:ZMYM2-like/QRICH1 C-terminal domain-containing protein n=1 Tax=Merluccius polli TaxID=89951 RepID=A0AA47MIC7_MERPO|nr:hypothetical protein N1851_022126 [Merluccius polli]
MDGDFLADKNMDINFKSYTAATLNDVLRLFYASVQSTKEGGEYTVASLRSLRAGVVPKSDCLPESDLWRRERAQQPVGRQSLFGTTHGINRHLSDVNIINDPVFKTSNAVFKAILKRYIKSGKDTSTILASLSRIFKKSDVHLRCLPIHPSASSERCGLTSSCVLLGVAGRGAIIDEHGVEYVSLAHNPQTKNHKDPNEPHKENLRGFMFARPGDPLCPVKSIKKYISKCPPDAKSLYLHPKHSITVASDVWYSREPMGVHYLGNMLKKISEEVGLWRVYTNHSLRSTAVGRLSDAGLETRQIMSLTGHRCERSLQA